MCSLLLVPEIGFTMNVIFCFFFILTAKLRNISHFFALFLKKCVPLQSENKYVTSVAPIFMGQLQEKYKLYREPQKFMEADVYPYFRAIEGKQGTEVDDVPASTRNEALFHCAIPSGVPRGP